MREKLKQKGDGDQFDGRSDKKKSTAEIMEVKEGLQLSLAMTVDSGGYFKEGHSAALKPLGLFGIVLLK